MWKPHEDNIRHMIGDDDLVLDVGGWADPFKRANFVVDICPYETRGLGYHGVGRLPQSCVYPFPLEGEFFTKASWVIHDICSVQPLPFSDKMFDFVVCSHTLEDVRDPIRVCSEIVRVGKAGYIEMPSRLWEQTHRLSGIVGEGHHRWMAEIFDNHIRFSGKPHFLHTSQKYHVPYTYIETEKTEIDKISWLFWKESFTFEEPINYWNAEVENYIRQLEIPRKYYGLDKIRFLHQKWWDLEDKVLSCIEGDRKPTGRKDDLWTWEALFVRNREFLGTSSRGERNGSGSY